MEQRWPLHMSHPIIGKAYHGHVDISVHQEARVIKRRRPYGGRRHMHHFTGSPAPSATAVA